MLCSYVFLYSWALVSKHPHINIISSDLCEMVAGVFFSSCKLFSKGWEVLSVGYRQVPHHILRSTSTPCSHLRSGQGLES